MYIYMCDVCASAPPTRLVLPGAAVRQRRYGSLAVSHTNCFTIGRKA